MEAFLEITIKRERKTEAEKGKLIESELNLCRAFLPGWNVKWAGFPRRVGPLPLSCLKAKISAGMACLQSRPQPPCSCCFAVQTSDAISTSPPTHTIWPSLQDGESGLEVYEESISLHTLWPWPQILPLCIPACHLHSNCWSGSLHYHALFHLSLLVTELS